MVEKVGHVAISRGIDSVQVVVAQIEVLKQTHWRSEIQKHLKSQLLEGQISNGPVLKWSGFSYGYGYCPNHSKSRHFCPDFKSLGFRISDPI